MNGIKPKVTYDEIEDFKAPNGAASRARVRVVELDDETVGIVFSENRASEYPWLEVVNPGMSVTNAIETLAHLAESRLELIPEGKKVRWFEHYQGTSVATEDPDLYRSTFSEVFFQYVDEKPKPPDEGNFRCFTVSPRTSPGRWRDPYWKHISIGDGEMLMGFGL